MLPAPESLGEMLARLLPYWIDVLVPERAAGWTVLVMALGDSLRALVCHLDRLSHTELTATRIGPGAPLMYPVHRRPASCSAGRYARARSTHHDLNSKTVTV